MDLFRIFIKKLLYKLPLKLLLIIVIALLTLLLLHNNSYCYTNEIQEKSFTSGLKSTRATVTDENIHTAFDNALDYHMHTLGYSAPTYYIIDVNTGGSGGVIITFLQRQNAYASTTGGQDIYIVTDGNFCQYAYWGSQNFGTTNVWVDDWNVQTTHNISRYDTRFNNFNIYYAVGGGLYHAKTDYYYVIAPYFTNTSDIPTWNYRILIIQTGTITPYYEDGDAYTRRTINLEVTNQTTGIVYTIDCWPYLENVNNTTAIIKIPQQEVTRFNVRNGLDVSFDLYVSPDDYPNSTGDWSIYPLGSFTLTLTDEEAEQINEDTQKDTLDTINDEINNVNNNINNLNGSITDLNDSITDDNVDDVSSQFSSLSSGFEIEDPSGLEQVFQKLYNAFCTDEVINLTFTIPFVNKPVTISSGNISARYPVALKSIVSVFVWGIIGLWVLKDIRSIVNKIAEGNAESVGSDVKKEVL